LKPKPLLLPKPPRPDSIFIRSFNARTVQTLRAFFCLRKSPILLQVGFVARQPTNFRPAMPNPQDHSRSTIAAIATAAGAGAVSMIRISGPAALDVADMAGDGVGKVFLRGKARRMGVGSAV
jgi:hypothetical protein